MAVLVPVDPLCFLRQIEELSSQFAHVSCQSTGEAAPVYPPSQGYIYAAPPPPNPPSYCQPSPQVQRDLIYVILCRFFDLIDGNECFWCINSVFLR